jgi:hypothetical protein
LCDRDFIGSWPTSSRSERRFGTVERAAAFLTLFDHNPP